MKKTKKLTFIEWNNQVFISSLKKIDLSIFLIIFLDALFYTASGLLIFFWFQRVIQRITSFQVPTDIVSLGYEKANELVKDIRIFYIMLIASFVLVILAIIFLASILKGIIWARTLKANVTFALISKFLILNLIWMGFWLTLIILMSIVLDPAASAFIIGASILISLYFTNTLYTIFMAEPRLRAILETIKINIMKIRFFIVPYFIIGLLSYILLRLNSLAKFKYSSIIAIIVMITLAAIVRYYHSTLVNQLGKANEQPSK